MKLRTPLRAFLIAATGACGLLSVSTAQAEIRTGSASVDVVLPPFWPVGVTLIDNVLWDVSRGSYYSPSYLDHTSNPFVPWGTAQVYWDFGSPNLRTFTLFQADTGSDFSKVQFYTGPLDLDALVDANQTFDTSGRPEIIAGDLKRFGYSVIMPESPSPLYGWVELDGSDSTPDNLIVRGTWAYDTTGAGITVGTVPEPTTLVLVGLGCLALLARHLFRRKQS
jgi:hypothetical protein